MNKNDETAARNKEQVYSAGDSYHRKYGQVPKQVHLCDLCPALGRDTVSRYFKEWLVDRNLQPSPISKTEKPAPAKLVRIFNESVREREAEDHKEIHDLLTSTQQENDVLLALNTDLTAQLKAKINECQELREKNANLSGQLEKQEGENGKLIASVRGADTAVQRYQKAKLEAEDREREVNQKLQEALIREQHALAEAKMLRESISNTEVLQKILSWIEQPSGKQSKPEKAKEKSVPQIRS